MKRLLGKMIRYSPLCGTVLLLAGCGDAPTRSAPVEGRSLTPPSAVSSRKIVATPVVKAEPSKEPGIKVFPLPEAPDKPLPPVAVNSAQADKLPDIAPATDPAVRGLLAQAQIAKARGDRGAARATLERAMKIKPGDGQVWFRLAELNYADSDYDQAATMAQRACELEPKNAALVTQAKALMAQARAKLPR